MYDYIILGGGILGLACARRLSQEFPNAKLALLEKEMSLAFHQTGRNSGVIHAGVYYTPGSLKAKFCKAGQAQMLTFCKEHGIPFEVCGKTIVAVEERELADFHALYEKAQRNGVSVKKLSLEELKEREPHLNAIAALHVESTGIVDYTAVSKKYAELFEEAGGEIFLNTKVLKIHESESEIRIETEKEEFTAKQLIVCAGLQSDRMAEKSALESDFRVIPFRGEYYDIVSEKKNLVKNLIYPVPNPKFPFLGVHFTRHIDGRVSIGPNALLSLSRENYEALGVSMKDLLDTLSYPGFWKFSSKHILHGCKELLHAKCMKLYLRQVNKYFPQIQADDLKPAPSGIRAQSLSSEGVLVEDFIMLEGAHKRSIHLCNAPSPAATSSLPIAEAVVANLLKTVSTHESTS
jgi:L-2-hydroxyglutarate oxidase